ncbi:M949_RS01915 family surface polysaccharide biosynthesis protein [Mucilaginibacter sp. L3T2-6]|uniref:M949_RS01915 family surface polysaccharide biosynthesis protein n=1 Tax=Mucilaginibacter sp. L3T2-6 TaxID=3062491 RepID=UPI002675B40C|nr:hypothetical protein [Mucilaginibacter sp. L3T2-6]MDO3641314.1 hypothetical protein [Mucilaginibacter sp. L3T2-6]MDV6213926.1 hypothetical protein [Mucilaginibacter sp. L3T2-6]
MRYLHILTLVLISPAIISAQQVTHLKKNAIPASMIYKGDFSDAVKYADKEGTHTVIVTKAFITTPADDNESVYTSQLHVFSYLQTAITTTLEWQLNDEAGPCGPDADSKLRPGSLTITDLDHNGIDEVWFVYRTSCQDALSPNPMKVIMREGVKKYAIRGTTHLKLKHPKTSPYIGGDYTADENFKAAPQSFRDYANQLWMKNREEAGAY